MSTVVSFSSRWLLKLLWQLPCRRAAAAEAALAAAARCLELKLLQQLLCADARFGVPPRAEASRRDEAINRTWTPFKFPGVAFRFNNFIIIIEKKNFCAAS